MRGALFELVYRHPDLLLEHGQLYMELLRHEAGRARRHWVRRATMLTASGGLAFAGVLWLGVSLTLALAKVAAWTWQLFAVPGAALVLAGVVWALARSEPPKVAETLAEQFGKDWSLLKDTVSAGRQQPNVPTSSTTPAASNDTAPS